MESPWYQLEPSQLALHSSWSGWLETEQRRITHREIGEKALQMIADARTVIVASIFLFDNFYSDEPPGWDIVEALTNAIVTRKRENPELVVAIMLDPSNRAYSNRIAPAVARLSAAGADIFYSDLLATRAHTPLKFSEALHHSARSLSQISAGWLSRVVKPWLAATPLPFVDDFDGQPANMQMVVNAALIKANHRKILVSDSDSGYEALVSSANPHNASTNSTNFAISVTGELARYIYGALRLEVAHSIRLAESDYVMWHRQASESYRQNYLASTLTPIPPGPVEPPADTGKGEIRAKFLTEERIKHHIMDALANIDENDELRIQMFYLSDFEVIRALMKAATVTRAPVKLLLDPNTDAFGLPKDGTPNRQVAALLMGNLSPAESHRLARYFPDLANPENRTARNITVRWFDTHGEQNHAKIASITNAAEHKYRLLHGSANWTGKNLNGTNLEANLHIDGAAQLTRAFNRIFDGFFYNRDLGTASNPANSPALRYSLSYDHPEYSVHSGIDKWIRGERYGFVTW